MDDTQRARNHRNENVAEFIDQNQTELDTTAAVTGALKTQLLAKIAETLANDIIATQDNTGVTETKNEDRELLVTSARECLNFLVKHYTTANNKNMLRQIDYNKSELENADNTVMEESAQRINDIATPLAAPLLAIGYTALMKTAFDTNLDNFNKQKAKPKVAIRASQSFGVDVEENLNEADAIQALLDVEINLIQFSKPNLYRTYYLVRLIDDSPSTGGNTITADIDANGSKKVRAITYDALATITMKVTGTEPIDFFFKDAGASVGLPITVSAGGNITRAHSDFAPSGDELWAKNSSLTNASSYKVTFN